MGARYSRAWNEGRGDRTDASLSEESAGNRTEIKEVRRAAFFFFLANGGVFRDILGQGSSK